jgi:hypothetical protein
VVREVYVKAVINCKPTILPENFAAAKVIADGKATENITNLGYH